MGVWDLETGDNIYSNRYHTAPVFAVQLHGNSNFLASGSKDGTIKLHDLRSPFTKTFRPMNSPIFSLQMNDNKIVTGHGNGQVSVTHIDASFKVEKTLGIRCHTSSVWTLHYNDRYMVTGSGKRRNVQNSYRIHSG